MKTPDRNDLKLDTIVVLENISQSIDFGFKWSRVIVRVRVRVTMSEESVPVCIGRECTLLLVANFGLFFVVCDAPCYSHPGNVCITQANNIIEPADINSLEPVCMKRFTYTYSCIE